MLHILLLIIKCIGIILAFLLAVILLTVLLILFCPVRYRAKASKSAEDWEVSGKISWLFGLFSVIISRGSSGSLTQIRLCKVKISTWQKLFARKKKNVEKTQMRESSKLVKQQDTFSSDPALPRKKKQVPETISAKSSEENEKPVPEKNISDENVSDKKISQNDFPHRSADSSTHKESFLKRFWKNITDKCRSIQNTVKKIITAFRKLCRTMSLWKEFLERSQTKAAFYTTWQQILVLLRHAGPQKWKGCVDLGLDDPAVTGQLLAALGAAYPVFRGCLSVNPVWDKKILEGNVHVKGRVYGVVLLYAAVRLYLNKDVKKTFQWILRQAG